MRRTKKNGKITPLDFSCVVTVKSTVEISQNFVAFSEYMNFIMREPSFKVIVKTISNTYRTKPSLIFFFRPQLTVQAVCDSILINSLNVGADKTDNTRQPNKGWPDFIWLAGKACLTQSKLLHSFERRRSFHFVF